VCLYWMDENFFGTRRIRTLSRFIILSINSMLFLDRVCGTNIKLWTCCCRIRLGLIWPRCHLKKLEVGT
jgi:hypothetical protein